MSPYYESGGITIFHGDCREVLPTLGRFDLLLTDPPYGIDWNTNYSRFTNSMQAAPQKDERKIEGDASTEMMELALSIPANQRIVWGCHLSPWLVKSTGSWLVWDKRFDTGTAMLADAELAWWSKGAGVYIHKHTWQGMIGDKSGSPRKRLHPSEKPLGLMRWCIERAKPTNVLDTFAGSLPVALACKLAGIECVCIEREERYCERGVERLRQGVLDFSECRE